MFPCSHRPPTVMFIVEHFLDWRNPTQGNFIRRQEGNIKVDAFRCYFL